jgi:DNA-binding transcriptional ArsR family regulator
MKKEDLLLETDFKILENHFKILESLSEINRAEINQVSLELKLIYFFQKISSKYYFVLGISISIISILLAVYSLIKIDFLIYITIITSLILVGYTILYKLENNQMKKKMVKDEIKYGKEQGLSDEQIKKNIIKNVGLL